MIQIRAHDGSIQLGPLEENHWESVVGLLNSSGEYRYTMGNAYPVTYKQLTGRMNKLESSKNDFFAGVFRSILKDEACDSSPCVYSTEIPDAGCHSKLELVGVVSGTMINNYLWIKLLAILPECRKKGIGSRAVKMLIWFSSKYYGISEVLLSVVRINENGFKFWQGQGFSETGRFYKDLFGDDKFYEIIIMNKKL